MFLMKESVLSTEQKHASEGICWVLKKKQHNLGLIADKH